MSLQLADDVARHFQPRSYLIGTPHTPYHGVDDSPEEHVFRTYDLFLPLDGTGPHYPHARCWSHVRLGKVIEPLYFFFTLLILMCETVTEGALRPISSKRSNPEEYKTAVTLYAKRLLNKATTNQTQVLKRLVTQDRFVDLRFKHDVEQEKIRLQSAAGGGEEEEEDDEEERGGGGGGEEDTLPAHVIAEAVVRQLPVPEPPSYAWAAAFSFDSESNASVVRADDEVISDMRCRREFMVTRNQARLNAAAAAAASASAAAAAGARGKQPAAAAAGAEYPEDAPDKVPKIDFVVTVLPKAGGSVKEHHQVAGIMVRFLVRDNSINPGTFFNSLLRNLDMRARRRSTASAGRGAAFADSELFPNYSGFFNTHHPAGDSTSKQTYFKAATGFLPSLLSPNELQSKTFNRMDFSDYSNPFHLANLLTTERAVSDMRKAGVDSFFTDGGANVWWSSNNGGVAKFPNKNVAPTYKYNPAQVFFAHNRYIGLSEQYFPHIDLDQDFLSSLMSGANIERFLGGQQMSAVAEQEKVNSSYAALRDIIKNSFLIDRKTLQDNKLINYDTPNEFVHRAAETAIMETRIGREFPAHYAKTFDDVLALKEAAGKRGDWRSKVTDELDRRMQECSRYALIRTKAQEACVKTFSSLWLTEGDIDRLNVPDSIRALQKWLVEKRFPHLTREYMLWDPDMGILSNSLLRSVKIYACIAKIVQPIVCLLGEGLFSCYQWIPRELAFNLMAHGKYEVGKTYAAITTLIRFSTVPGTVEEYTAATAAADTTANHAYDKIIASDETANWKVNSKAAEQNQGLVNREKVKLTSRKTELKTFVQERGPMGENLRWCRTLTTDHYVTMVEVTNCVVEATNALSSRYHRITIAQPQVPPRELEGYMSAPLKADSIVYLQINQYLSACACKAVMCGVMLAPEMQLFHDISNRVLEYLVEQKAVSHDVGSRSLEIMKPYARQLIYHTAIHCAFDMPGGECYKKPFESSMIRFLQPYLYCTVEVIWWCWTALASAWVEEQNRNVLNAACRLACKGSATTASYWRSGYTPYEIYERDTDNRVPWRQRENQYPDGDAKNAKLVDLQYLTIETGGRGGASLESLCRQISPYTQPHLDWTDVYGALNVLSTMHVTPSNGGYQPQPMGMFQKWHKFTTLPKEDTGLGGLKNTGVEMPPYYMSKNADPSVARCENDMPSWGSEIMLPVVDLTDKDNGKIHIMPSAAESFNNDIIVSALIYATMSKTFPHKKMLLGMPNAKDTMQMQIFSCPEEVIEEAIEKFDLDAGWVDGDWQGPDSILPDERPVPRSVGIAFNRKGGIAKADQDYFTAVPLAPVADGDKRWSEQSARDMERMEEVRYICKDLDAESARRQHMACGRGFDDPVLDPKYILARYKHECAHMPNGEKRKSCMDIDYPHDMLPELDERKAIWESGSATKNAAQISMSIFAKSRTEHNKPKKDTVIAHLEKRKATHNYSKRAREKDSTPAREDGPFIPATVVAASAAEADEPRRRRREPAAAAAAASAGPKKRPKSANERAKTAERLARLGGGGGGKNKQT
jgi:hypothetical protein